MDESFATVLETVGDLRRDRLAVSHGDRQRTWAELDERAARLAAHLAASGIGPGSRVAIALYNGIEYLESVFAVLKLRAVPLNVNYRYQREEIVALLDDAQAEAVVFDATLAGRVGAARPALPRLRALVQVGGDDDVAAGTAAYERAVAAADPAPRIQRGNDHWLMYTGGTTGRPKGVLSRHSGLFATCSANGLLLLGEPFPQDLAELRATVERLGTDRDAMVCLPAPPLMHATGMYTTFGALLAGGRVVYLPSRSYDPDELAATVQREGVDTVSLVGDVFARPLADALDRAAAAGRPYDLSSLRRIISVGVTWSADVKQRLLRHADIVCRDLVASSEGGPYAVQETRRGDRTETARFRLFPGAQVVDDRGRPVTPGSGDVGLLAAPVDEHVGYAGDSAATAATFRELGGRRWVVPGDMASIEADGTVVLHGRGSQVINTGGEKVFAEEVEQALLTHPAVRDVMVVSVPDERWGSRVVAVVALHPGRQLTLDQASAFVGERLADHKRPRGLVVVDELRRSPSGKADLRWARSTAAAGVEPDTSRRRTP